LSHIVTIQTEIRDAAAVIAACRRLSLPEPVQGTVEVFATTATGLQVQLPGWNYPVVCDLSTGKAHYDNYGGVWGQEQELDRFLQAYAAESAKIEARRNGHMAFEQPLENGYLKVTVEVSGGAA
jgi:hypothetical protein